ncbi:hypothetical protein [Dietzia sp. PP-33]|uniref:hypothetical protein n=1 Tax=Dietzia sp. PP-33 TaxID=2957500 RepID=UPI0029B2E93D|nr:hypothetical protein [Dietzia sp. PP-33]MDX2355951.1 hypothetical protein [Dietzia sp. PP-33]
MAHDEPGADRVLDKRVASLVEATKALGESGDVGKSPRLRRVLDGLRLVLIQDGGARAVQSMARELETAGLFEGTDWAAPSSLVAALSTGSLRSPDSDTVVMEIVSNLRLVAVAKGEYVHPEVSAEDALQHVKEVLATNASLLFTSATEAERVQQGRMAKVTRTALSHIAQEIGFDSVLDQLVEEIWRILRQRPIQVDHIKKTITQVAVARQDPDVEMTSGGFGVDRLISSIFGTTEASREDPGVDVYRSRLEAMDEGALQYEAAGFARSMHDTGLVSAYHPVLLRFLREKGSFLLSEALGLSSTGRESLLCFHGLVDALIDAAVHPETAQSVYGLALLLERGILFQPPVAPALWRLLGLPLSENSLERLALAFGPEHDGRVWLLSGTLSMLGQPLGVGQGDNPTCQSARALSMWAYNDPDYLLQTIAWAARDDEVVMHFEGRPISSRGLDAGLAGTQPVDLDPVSLLVVPHLDRIYAEMGRQCADREGDPHRWVNPEFHGWWAARGFRINVDVESGRLTGLEDFLRHFYGSYHPYHNGNQPLIHPQPAGVAVTNSSAKFVGWHAITILRVALDPDEVMRVYFFNPNNDSGQDWGDGVVVSTAGSGERFGESSLPFEQFASRLYIFHFDALEPGETGSVAAEEIARATEYIHSSWGADRLPEI